MRQLSGLIQRRSPGDDISTSACTGLRWGELVALGFGDIDREARVIDGERRVVEVAGHLYVEAIRLGQPGLVIAEPGSLREAGLLYKVVFLSWLNTAAS